MFNSRNTKRPRQDIQSGLQPPADDSSKAEPVTPTGTVIPDDDPKSTPIAYKVSGSDIYSSQFFYQNAHNLQLEEETRGKWVGPMDPALFLKRYLPPVDRNIVRPKFEKKTFENVARVKDEIAMYSPFIDAVSCFGPNLKFVDAHAKVDTRCDGITVDICVYNLDGNGECTIEKNDFSQMEIPIEFKHKTASDPFVDFDKKPKATAENPYPFERNDSAHCMAIRGQLAAYGAALIGAQFRLHFFSVLIIGQWARLLRWDRGGAVVTKRFAYKDIDFLAEFFWRYSHAPLYHPSGLSRGHDPSIVLPSYHKPTSREQVAKNPLIAANYTSSDKKNHHREFRVMMIPDRHDGVEHPFLFSYPPRYVRLSPFGRSTRPMLAKSMIPLHHYRMSLEEVGRPLNEFRSSYEFLTAVADAMEAHDCAFYDAHILHRDISAGNILISASGRGMLIDWDLSQNMRNSRSKARRPDRTGTWQFLSVYLLEESGRIQSIADDRESCIYVILWHMLRHTRHNKLAKLPIALEMFDQVTKVGQEGGSLKHLYIALTHWQYRFENRPHLDQLLSELCKNFAVRYAEPPHPDDETAQKTSAAKEKNISERSWLVTTIRKYLALEGWPQDDAAHLNEIMGVGTLRQSVKQRAILDQRATGPSTLKRSFPE